MGKVTIWSLAVAACAMLAALPASAATNTAATKPAATASTSARTSWPPETLTGKITMVEPNAKLVVITAQDGVPFDLLVTPGTRISSAGEHLNIKELQSYQNKNVSLKFVPESRGDVAETILINKG